MPSDLCEKLTNSISMAIDSPVGAAIVGAAIVDAIGSLGNRSKTEDNRAERDENSWAPTFYNNNKLFGFSFAYSQSVLPHYEK